VSNAFHSHQYGNYIYYRCDELPPACSGPVSSYIGTLIVSALGLNCRVFPLPTLIGGDVIGAACSNETPSGIILHIRNGCGFDWWCSVTPVSVREISPRPAIHNEAVNLYCWSGNFDPAVRERRVEKANLNSGERIANDGFSGSGLAIESILVAKNYEIKGLRHRYTTTGEGQAAVTLLVPQPESLLKEVYTASYVYVPITIINAGGSGMKREPGSCRIIDDESFREPSAGKPAALATDTTLPLAMLA
jgi:hypothetical protein